MLVLVFSSFSINMFSGFIIFAASLEYSLAYIHCIPVRALILSGTWAFKSHINSSGFGILIEK